MDYTPLRGTGVKRTREEIIKAFADTGFDVCFEEYHYQDHKYLKIGKAKAGAKREWTTYLPADQVGKGKRGCDLPMERVSVILDAELDLEKEEDVYFCPTNHKWQERWYWDEAANKNTRRILLILVELDMIKEDR